MNTTLTSSAPIDLLSRITEQKLSQKDLTPTIIFLAALITILLGVMFADGTVTDEEKQRWQQTINGFIPPQSNLRQLAQFISKGVRQNQTYKKFNQLLILTNLLSESERLLLIGFGYEMSAADEKIDPYEKKYLEAVASKLEISPQHLLVLEAGFTHEGSIELVSLDEVRYLLNPSRFYALDTAIVKAASNMLLALPDKSEHQATQQHIPLSYTELKKFQEYRKQLDNFCYQIFQIIQNCNNHSLLPKTLIEETKKISQKLQSQRFRLAVVGEFSQGKSTLLNALLGEEIQPVRAIPCSGTVTVLRYGAQKRVVCCYKDGRQEEIPLEQYQVKAAISEEAALNSERHELLRSEIDEIVFEHPDLDLCRSGVEIVDSPGLNECNDSTQITNKLLQNTDAIILLINASRPLTQWERDKVNELRTKLNNDNVDEPVNNVFVVANFWDLLRREKDRQDVRQRIEIFFQGQNNIIKGKNRIHFISAQAALDAILQGTEDEYLKAFQYFTQSVEKFLTFERGSLEIKQSVTKLKSLITASLDGLSQVEEILEGKVNLSEAEKQKILEQIGEASGRDVRIHQLADQLMEQVIDQTNQSVDEWLESLAYRMAYKSESWNSEYSPVWNQNKLIQDYVNQFVQDLSGEINSWASTKLKDVILKQNIELLDNKIAQELQAIQANFRKFDQQVKTNFSEQLNFSITGISDEFAGVGGFLGGLGMGGALAAGLLAFTGIGLVAVIVASLGTVIAGSFGLGMLDVDGLKDKIKEKVFELGLQKFEESIDKFSENLDKVIVSVFNNRVESANRVIAQAIYLYENLLEQQEKVCKETIEQREAEKALIEQQRKELEQVQSKIEAILEQYMTQ